MRIVNINAAFILFVKIENNTKRVETKSVCKQTPYLHNTRLCEHYWRFHKVKFYLYSYSLILSITIKKITSLALHSSRTIAMSVCKIYFFQVML